MKHVTSTLCLCLALVLGGCASRSKTIVVKDSCEVLQKTLYKDGKFQFTDPEIDALSETNAVKIDSVKRFYRDNCLGKDKAKAKQ